MTDAIAMYNSLFVHEYRKAPWILLLQDHGLGGNYDRFGRGAMHEDWRSLYKLAPICEK